MSASNKTKVEKLFSLDLFSGISLSKQSCLPIFCLHQRKSFKPFVFENDFVKVEVVPSSLGLLNMKDKEVLIYIGFLIIEKLKHSKEKDKNKIVFKFSEFFNSIEKYSNGANYKTLKYSLKKIAESEILVKPKKEMYGQPIRLSFFEKLHIVKSEGPKKIMLYYEINISNWVFKSLARKNITSFNHEYFSAQGSLQKRLYELAVLYCKKNTTHKMTIEELLLKTGSIGTVNRLRDNLKLFVMHDSIPSFEIQIIKKNIIIFKDKEKRKEKQKNLNLVAERSIPANVNQRILRTCGAHSCYF